MVTEAAVVAGADVGAAGFVAGIGAVVFHEERRFEYAQAAGGGIRNEALVDHLPVAAVLQGALAQGGQRRSQVI